jgi:hypothetical protein
MTEWEQVGEVGVDAGLMWLGDPCYIMGNDASRKWDTWSDFCDNLRDKHWDYTGVTQYNFSRGHVGLGVCVSTGYGDGVYPVEVKRNHEGRIAEVRIVFIEEE